MADRDNLGRHRRRRRLVAAAVIAFMLIVAPPHGRAVSPEEFAQGYELFKSELYRGAIALFERGLAVEPDNGLAHYYTAESYYKLGELQPALDHYRSAVAFLPPGAEATRADNMIVAIEAEFDAAATTELPAPEPQPSQPATTEPAQPQATTASAPPDWNAEVTDTGTLGRAIAEYYEVNQPAPEAKGSTITNVYSIQLKEAAGDRAVVAFRCEVRASHGKTGIFRAHVVLAADGGTYRVLEFVRDERFDIPVGATAF